MTSLLRRTFATALVVVASGRADDLMARSSSSFHRESVGEAWMLRAPYQHGPGSEFGKGIGAFRGWSDSAGSPLSRSDTIALFAGADGSYASKGWIHYLDRSFRKVRCRVRWIPRGMREGGSEWALKLEDTLVGLAGVYNHRGEPSPWVPVASLGSRSSLQALFELLPTSFTQGEPIASRNGTWLSARYNLADQGDPRRIRIQVDPWGSGRLRCRSFQEGFLPVGDTVGNCPSGDFSIQGAFDRGDGVLMDRAISDPELSAATPWGAFEPGRVLESGWVVQFGSRHADRIWIHGTWHCSSGLKAFLGRADVPAKVLMGNREASTGRLRVGDVSSLEVVLFPDSLWVPRPNLHRLGNAEGLVVRLRPNQQQASVEGWSRVLDGGMDRVFQTPSSFVPKYWTVLDPVLPAAKRGVHAILEDGSMSVDREGKVASQRLEWHPQSGSPEDRVIETISPKGARTIRLEPDASFADDPTTESCDMLGEICRELKRAQVLRRMVPASVSSYDSCVAASKCPAPDTMPPGLDPGWILSARWPESIRTGLDSVRARRFCQYRRARLPRLEDGFQRWRPEDHHARGWVVPSAQPSLWESVFTWCEGGVPCRPPPAPFHAGPGPSEIGVLPIPVEAAGSVVCLPR